MSFINLWHVHLIYLIESYIFNFESFDSGKLTFSYPGEFYCFLLPILLWVKHFYRLNFTKWGQKLLGCCKKILFWGVPPTLIYLFSYCSLISKQHAQGTAEFCTSVFPHKDSLAPLRKLRKALEGNAEDMHFLWGAASVSVAQGMWVSILSRPRKVDSLP